MENTNKIFINSKSEVPADYLTTEGMYWEVSKLQYLKLRKLPMNIFICEYSESESYPEAQLLQVPDVLWSNSSVKVWEHEVFKYSVTTKFFFFG